MDNIIWFLVISAAIYVFIEGVKKIPQLESNKIFNDLLPIIPQVLGVVLGIICGPHIIEGLAIAPSATAGLLAGGLSASSYSVIKKVLEKRAEREA